MPELCIPKLEALAVWLEAGAPEHNGVTQFYMADWIRPLISTDGPIQFDWRERKAPICGSACCIAGTVAVWESGGDVRAAMLRRNGPSTIAREALGLTIDQANELFTPNAFDPDISLRNITPAWAARTVRRLIATGVVDWQSTREP